MQGKILAMPTTGRPGLIGGDDGQRYAFDPRQVSSGPVREGDRIDFKASGEQATDIYVLRAPSLIDAGKSERLNFYFSAKGRIARGPFWRNIVIVTLGAIVLGWIPVIGWLLAAAATWSAFALTFKRFHDRGYSGAWSLLAFLPFLGAVSYLIVAFLSNNQGHYRTALWLWITAGVITLVQCVLVYFREGQRGPNKYGPDPLERS